MANRTFPIAQLLQHRRAFSQRAFAQEAAGLVQANCRINARVEETGLVLEGIGELDLEKATETLYERYGRHLHVGKPAIKYIRKDGMLHEPYMSVVVITPADFIGFVVGDLSARRGLVATMEDAGQMKEVRAEVPLAEMFGYSTALRAHTLGQARYEIDFLEYRSAPRGPDGPGPGGAAAMRSA